jgi:hypothetical protein
LTFVKLGEEARVDLTTFTVEGSRGKKHRNAIHRLEREGGSFRVIRAEHVDCVMDQLRAVSDDWLAQHAGQFNDEEGQARFNEVVSQISDATIATVKSSLERVKTTYPNVYASGKEFFDQLLINIRRNTSSAAAARNAPSESSGCSGGTIGGGGIGVGFIIYIIIKIIMAVLRTAPHRP